MMKMIRYSSAILIGIFLVGVALFENNHYSSFRSKAVMGTVGLAIIVMGIANAAKLTHSRGNSQTVKKAAEEPGAEGRPGEKRKKQESAVEVLKEREDSEPESDRGNL